MSRAVRSDLIEEWNGVEVPARPAARVGIHDETLRDGLQTPSVRQPDLDERLEILHLMDRIGVDSVDLGMPVSNRSAWECGRRLVEEIESGGLRPRPVFAARTLKRDISAVAEIAQATGTELWVMAFVGASPIRMYAEGWDPAATARDVGEVVEFARHEGLRVCLVTEDTTRSRLDVALDIYLSALDAGAERVCVCDTVGYAVPWGAAAVVRWLKLGLADRGFDDVGIDWHGHNDRGLALANSLAAACAGADRLHASALGIGERAGNTSMEQLLVNLDDLGWRDGDLTALPQYCAATARSCAIDIPANQPFVGADVYRTATGVHAAAIRKARAMGDTWTADRVYAGVPASALGLNQRIEVGPGSGRANIMLWLADHGIEATPDVVSTLEDAIAVTTRLLTDEELMRMIAATQREGR